MHFYHKFYVINYGTEISGDGLHLLVTLESLELFAHSYDFVAWRVAVPPGPSPSSIFWHRFVVQQRKAHESDEASMVSFVEAHMELVQADYKLWASRKV